MGKKTRVAIIYGGRSGEHEVSLQTALAVINAFDFSRYEIQPVYITKKGEWRIGTPLKGPVGSLLELTFSGQREEQLPAVPFLLLPFGKPAERPHQNDSGERGTVDVVFPLLHGTYGEDGTIQGLLEMANIPYVGAGVLASAVGMDKVMMKKAFAQAGLPQAIYRYFTRKQWEKDRDEHIMEIEVAIGYPCFVKPANLGSSVGISKAKNREQLLQAVDLAFRYDRKVIVEEYIDAREIEVSVLGNDEPIASVPGEIIPCNEFYDYNAKYVDGKSQLIIPADIPEEKAREIREMAIAAFQAIDACGLSRVDFFLRRGDGQVLINEINTMPGFTPYSMYPMLWQASGKPYRELLDDLIRLAFERFEEKQKLDYGSGS